MLFGIYQDIWTLGDILVNVQKGSNLVNFQSPITLLFKDEFLWNFAWHFKIRSAISFIIWHVDKYVYLVFCYIALAAILNSEKPSRLGSPQWVKISLGHLDLSKNEIKAHDPDNQR